MAKITQWEFKVTGRANFPIDMLRYGRCWPKTESDSSAKYDRSVTHTIDP